MRHAMISMLVVTACGGGTPAGPDAISDTVDASAPDADCGGLLDEEVMIPMRDGEALAAFVRRSATGCALPTVLVQTPYDKNNSRVLWLDDTSDQPLFASAAYNFVIVDWRGFYGSMDAAVMGQQPWGEDGFDTVEWIAQQTWSDGNVGTWGVSALCVQQYRTAAQQPPHLRAAVPIFCNMNNTYEQYYPGGVLRREYLDTLGFLFGTNNVVLQHPYRDAVWQFAEGVFDAATMLAPMLVVAGWYDLNPLGSLRSFDQLAAGSPAGGEDRLLIGPWHHFATGGESAGGRPLTAQELLYIDAERKIQLDSLAFFDKHLRGIPSDADGWAAVRYLQDGDDVWLDAAAWPPGGTTPRSFYLAAGGALVDAAPTADTHDLPWDPADPSPTIGGATLRPDLLHGPHDQAPVTARADAAAFAGAPLAAPLTVRGAIALACDLATTGADADLAVRLTDVDTTGAHLLIGEGIRRLKLRDGYAAPSAVAPGTRYSLRVELTSELAYQFAPGHRVGVILSGGNYPRFERNPGTGDDFYDDATAPAAVTNTLFLDGACRLDLPVVP